MPYFTPPTTTESSDDFFFGRYQMMVGVSVVWNGATFESYPYPWLGDIADLTEGETWFQGGRTYLIDSATGSRLVADGFEIESSSFGYGLGGYGENEYGGPS